MQERSVLLTGATGSFGKRMLRALLADANVEQVVAFSRDELKQFTLSNELGRNGRIRWVLGDVRDQDALVRAARGVDLIVHAAALKQVVACEMNPLEAIKTNVIGASNVVAAALTNGVKKVVSLSTALVGGLAAYLISCRLLGIRQLDALLSLRTRFRR